MILESKHVFYELRKCRDEFAMFASFFGMQMMCKSSETCVPETRGLVHLAIQQCETLRAAIGGQRPREQRTLLGAG
jgi:hypothetical protein